MHSDHGAFLQAIKENKKIKLTWVGPRHKFNSAGQCVPIEYSPSVTNDEVGCYYIWESEAETGKRLLGLPASQIVSMKLSEETFDPAEYITPDKIS